MSLLLLFGGAGGGGTPAPLPGRTHVDTQAAQSALRFRRGAPRPHLAAPIVAPGRAVVAARTETLQAIQSHLRARRGVPAPVLAPPLVTVPFLAPPRTEVSQSLQAPLTFRRTRGGTHLAPPVVSPGRAVVAARTETLQSLVAPTRVRLNRTRVVTAEPIVAPGGPVIAGATNRSPGGRRSSAPNAHLATPIVSQVYVPPPVIPDPLVVHAQGAAQALQAPLRARRGVPKPHVAREIQGAPLVPFVAPPATVVQARITIPPARRLLPRPVVAPGAAVIAGHTITSQALASHLRARRGAPRPHLAPPNLTVVTFPPVATRPFIVSAVRASLAVRRGAPKPHLAPSIVGAPAPLPPLHVSAIKVFRQALRAPALARRTPRPHLAKPIVAPGGPVIAGGTRRSPGGRRSAAPNAHLPNPIVSPPVPPPDPPVVTRPKIVHAKPLPVSHRRLIRPHLAPSLFDPPPPPPIVTRPLSTQAIPRPTPLRHTPRPHIARAIVAPGRAVIPGRTQITAQAQRTCRLVRTLSPPPPHLAPSLFSPATRARVALTVETNRNYLGQKELMRQGVDARWSNRYSKTNNTRYSLIKESGTWSLVEMPKPTRIKEAQYFYQGGMDHDIDIAIANEIAAAGFGAFVTMY